MTSQAIDAGRLIDEAPWSAYQKALTLLAAMAVIFDGFDIQILGFAVPSIMKEWHLARAAFAPVLALGLAGMATGSPFAGYCGDRFGRKPALIGCVTLFGVATVATAFVHSLPILAVLRFITGMGAGGAVPNAGAFSAEFAPARRRPAAVKLTIVCIPLGGMVGGLIAAWVLPAFGWRALYMLGGALPLTFALIMLAVLPESPRFLAQRPAGWPALVRVLNRMGHSVPEGSAFEDTIEKKSTQQAPIRALFGPTLRRDTLGLWLAFFTCLSSIYLTFGWLPALLTSQGLSVASASQGLAMHNFGGVLGVLIWAVLMTAFGSRKPLIWGALATAASALAMILIPVPPQVAGTLLLGGLGLQGLLINAVQTSMYALAAHIYPTSVRSSGVAWAASMGRVGGIASSLFGAGLIGAGAGAFWGATALGLVFTTLGLISIRNHIPRMSQRSTS